MLPNCVGDSKVEALYPESQEDASGIAILKVLKMLPLRQSSRIEFSRPVASMARIS